MDNFQTSINARMHEVRVMEMRFLHDLLTWHELLRTYTVRSRYAKRDRSGATMHGLNRIVLVVSMYICVLQLDLFCTYGTVSRSFLLILSHRSQVS